MQTDLIDRAMKYPAWPADRLQIPQVRIEVNFKCGKACFYCRPTGEGLSIEELERETTSPVREMSADEIVAIARMLAKHGVNDFKLTGGDPMLRADILEIVQRLKAVRGISEVHLVTRHHRAGDLASALRDVGLDLLNFSLDSLNSATWTKVTRVQGHSALIEGIRKAARSGIRMKINTVVLKGINDHEIPALIEFAGEVGAELKLLDLINDIGAFPTVGRESINQYYVDLVPVAQELSNLATSVEIVTQPGGLGHPMPRFRMTNGATVTIKAARLGAYYGSICSDCSFFPCWDALMALRVTPNGMLQYCLLRSDNLVDLLGLLQRAGEAQADQAIDRVLGVFRHATPYTGEAITRIRGLPLIERQQELSISR